MRTFEGRVAVVTGAASGIGRATSVALAERGCAVALADIDADGMQETAERVRDLGRRVSTHRVDVADEERMRAFADEVVAEHGHVHVLVNNAGVSVTSPLEEQRIEDFQWLMGINFWGVVFGCKFFLPHLRRETEGHIVNISSMFGLIGLPSQSSYCASKFAVRGFSESLHSELAPFGIGVSSVHPGGIKTDIVKRSRGPAAEERDALAERFERFGTEPEKVANAIVRGIEANRLRILVTPEAHVTDWLKRVFPTLTSRLVAFGYGRQAARQ